MDADAEGDVGVPLAVEPELVGVIEAPGVTVGGGEMQREAVAGLHRAPANLGVPGDGPGQEGDRRFEAEELIEVAARPGGVAEPVFHPGVLGEVAHDVAERAPDSVEPAGEQRRDGADLLFHGEGAAQHRPVHDRRQDVVAVEAGFRPVAEEFPGDLRQVDECLLRALAADGQRGHACALDALLVGLPEDHPRQVLRGVGEGEVVHDLHPPRGEHPVEQLSCRGTHVEKYGLRILRKSRWIGGSSLTGGMRTGTPRSAGSAELKISGSLATARRSS